MEKVAVLIFQIARKHNVIFGNIKCIKTEKQNLLSIYSSVEKQGDKLFLLKCLQVIFISSLCTYALHFKHNLTSPKSFTGLINSQNVYLFVS